MKQRAIRGCLAGRSYPSDPPSLRKMIEHALLVETEANQPSSLPIPQAVILPHIDLRVNLGCYAHALRPLLHRRTFPHTVIILGVGHQCPAPFSVGLRPWRTVLGHVPVNQDWLNALQNHPASPRMLSPALRSFYGEHSIEFTVIWLQALRDLAFPGQTFTMVPVLLGGCWDEVMQGKPPEVGSPFRQLAQVFCDVYAQTDGRDILTVLSIDGCHVGPRFDHPFPVNAHIQRQVELWEERLWHQAATRHLKGFFNYLHQSRNFFFFDGVGALTFYLMIHHAQAHRTISRSWFEASDASLVTFSGGYLAPDPSVEPSGPATEDSSQAK